MKVVLLGGGLFSMLLGACRQEQLTPGGAKVATSQSAPLDSGWDPASCKSLGYIVGRGGGTFGGGFIANEDLIEYAMNDLRNQAEELGANFVQHDTPTMGQPGNDGATSTATVSGTAYRCEKKQDRTATAATAATPAKPATACVPGATQSCVGPGGCGGGQFCLDDGSRFSPCDCGSKEASAAPQPAADAQTEAAPAPQQTAPDF